MLRVVQRGVSLSGIRRGTGNPYLQYSSLDLQITLMLSMGRFIELASRRLLLRFVDINYAETKTMETQKENMQTIG